MKLGVIYCCYDSLDYLGFLDPWIKLKESLNIKLAGVHGCFEEMASFIEDNDEETLEQLLQLRYDGQLDFLYVQNDYPTKVKEKFIYQSEAIIRNYALQWLLKEGVTHVMLLDADEKYSEEEIQKLVKFLEKDNFTAWYSIEFKNLTFSEQTYTKSFCPPRIWRVNSSESKIKEIYYDNDINYTLGAQIVSYKQLSTKKIPLIICNPLHYTWLNNERSKNKIAYQSRHFAHGAGCSFKWNNEKNSLEWNDEYFKKTSQIPPKLHTI
jgi:hypothetical protein